MRRGGRATCAELLGFSAVSRWRGSSSTRSSASNTAATIQPASPRSKRGALTRRRAEGKLRNLETRLHSEPLHGTIGIGHTRWATHGKPTENNAHPHATEKLAVVHNGIIENFRELREELEKKGAKFRSETDTEVIAHLVTDEMKKGKTPVEAVKAALPRLRGAFALAFLFAGEEDLLIGARKGSPLAVGYGDGEMFLGSDAIALAPFTDTISYLEDGDWAVVTRKGVEVHDADGQRGRARGAEIERLGVPGRQGQPPPFHGEGNPRAARGRRPHAGALPRHGQRAGVAADDAAVRFQEDRAGGDLGLRHRLLRGPCRQILVRALRAAAGRDRRRLRVPLPRGAVSIRAISRCSSRNRARPPTRWRRCAMPRSRSSTCCRSSTCRPRPSPARATW